MHKNVEREAQEAAARSTQASSLRKCPFCAELIQREAIVCRYCGKDVPAEGAPVTRSVPEDLPKGSAARGRVYLAIAAVVVAAILYRVLSGGSSTPTGEAAPPVRSALTVAELTPPADPSKPYVVKLKELKIPGNKRSFDLEIVYPKTPALKDAYAQAGAEVAAWVRAHYDPSSITDVSGLVQIGDPEKPDSWAQMKDSPKGWVYLWFDARNNSVSKHLRNAEVVVPNVLSGAALATNNAEVEKRDADRLFEKKKTAAVGAELLKKSMRNPASFELIEVGISSTGAACYKYRAQNGFGGMNVAEAVFGNTFMTSEQEGFAAAWNRDCGGKTLTIVTDDVKTILSLVQN